MGGFRASVFSWSGQGEGRIRESQDNWDGRKNSLQEQELLSVRTQSEIHAPSTQTTTDDHKHSTVYTATYTPQVIFARNCKCFHYRFVPCEDKRKICGWSRIYITSTWWFTQLLAHPFGIIFVLLYIFFSNCTKNVVRLTFMGWKSHRGSQSMLFTIRGEKWSFQRLGLQVTHDKVHLIHSDIWTSNFPQASLVPSWEV